MTQLNFSDEKFEDEHTHASDGHLSNPAPQSAQPAAPPNESDRGAYPPPDAQKRVVPPKDSQPPFTHAPLTYNPAMSQTNPEQTALQDPQELAALKRTRSLATAGIVCGIVSFFVGGMFLSAIAIVIASMGYRTAANYLNNQHAQAKAEWKAQLTRLRTALVISVCAFVLSVLSFIFLYPVMIEFLQANGFDILSSGSGVSAGSAGGGSNGGSSGGSIWG